MPAMDQRRADYDEFTAVVRDLCQQAGIRRTLATGRGRPVDECEPMHRYLRATRGKPGRRAYYTVASLIALTKPEPADEATDPDVSAHLAGDLVQDASEPHTAAAWFRRPNFGTTLATAIRDAGYDEERTEQKLRLLTRLSGDQLHRRLPSEIVRLAGKDIHLDWAVLLGDLVERHYDSHRVNLRWYDAFADALETSPAA